MMPAERERESMTGHILGYHDQEYAKEVLEEHMDPQRLRAARHAKRSNGGGAITVRDLCAELSLVDLEEVLEILRS